MIKNKLRDAMAVAAGYCELKIFHNFCSSIFPNQSCSCDVLLIFSLSWRMERQTPPMPSQSSSLNNKNTKQYFLLIYFFYKGINDNIVNTNRV